MTAPLAAPDPAHFGAAVLAAGSHRVDEGAAHALGRQLLARWQEPSRGYHDDEHLAEVLGRLDELAGAGVRHAGEPEVLLAAWFHDAVYAGRPGADERASAALALGSLTGLGLAREVAQEVARLVLVTLDHQPGAGDRPGQALCDADLAILAARPSRYARYSRSVRQEYLHVPEPLFRAGRRRVLTGLLERARTGRPTPLYVTAPAQAWTAAAIRNLSAEIDALGSDPS